MASIKVNASDHPVAAVTVFRSSTAEVVRPFLVDLKQGQNRIEIAGLPDRIDAKSARISDLGGLAYPLAVTCTVDRSDPVSSVQPTQTVRQLVLKKQAIQDERQVRKEQDDILVGYAGSFKHEHALINIRPLEASAFLEDFGERRRACLAAIRDLDEQISDVERLIQSEREQKGVQKSGQMSSKVVAVILAKENCAVHLKLTYLVKEASWQPYYDLYATTTNGRYSSSVSLHYRAHIIQSTGEDWKDAKLTLSTSTAQATPNVNIPDLKPLKIKVRQNVPLGLAGAAQLQARKHVFGKPSFPAVSAFKPQWQPPYQKFGFADRSTSFLASFSSSSVDDASSNSTIACTGSSSGQVSSPIASTPSKSVCISKPNVDVASPGGGFFGAATDQAQPRTISTPFAPVIVGNTNLWLPVGGRWASLVDQSKQTSQPILAEFKVQDTEVSSVKHVKAEPLQTSPAILDSVAQKTAATDVHFLTKGKARLTIPGKDEARETSLFSGLQTTATPQRTDQPAAAYRIEGTTSIASDGAAHAVSLALLTLDAQVARVCVPRVHQGTFIECTVCNTSEYQMLPGPLSVYANDNYVSDTSVEEIRPNESFVCTLGVDAALHTTQIRTSTTKQDPQPPFSEWRKTTACTARTTIINRGTSAVSMLIVRDVFPLADDDQVQITIRKPMGLMEAEGGQELDIANDEQKVSEGEETREVNESLRVLERKVRWAKDIDEKRGKEEGRYEWLCGLEAKETVVLVAEWEIKTPYHVWWDEVSQ